MIRYGLHRLRADLVRAMHARGSGEAARRAKRGRQPLPSRAISHAWPFACFAFCSMDYRKKRDSSWSMVSKKLYRNTLKCQHVVSHSFLSRLNHFQSEKFFGELKIFCCGKQPLVSLKNATVMLHLYGKDYLKWCMIWLPHL